MSGIYQTRDHVENSLAGLRIVSPSFEERVQIEQPTIDRKVHLPSTLICFTMLTRPMALSEYHGTERRVKSRTVNWTVRNGSRRFYKGYLGSWHSTTELLPPKCGVRRLPARPQCTIPCPPRIAHHI